MTMVSAAFSSASVFAGLVAVSPLGGVGDLLLAVPVSAITGLSIWYFWPSRRPASSEEIRDLQKAIEAINVDTGVSTKEVIEAIRLGTEKLDRILEAASTIRSPNTTRRIKHIDSIGRKIIEDFRQDPKDVRIANSWLNSYLDETLTLVKGYAQLSRTGARSAEAQKQMAQFDDLLDLLEKKFQELLDRLLENDTMDFDVTMQVMKNRLQQEGI